MTSSQVFYKTGHAISGIKGFKRLVLTQAVTRVSLWIPTKVVIYWQADA